MAVRIAFLLLLPGTALLPAQEVCTMTGAVSDQQGSIIVGAKVSARSLATGAQLEATTNESGMSTLPFLRIGKYTVTAVMTGFKTACGSTSPRSRRDFRAEILHYPRRKSLIPLVAQTRGLLRRHSCRCLARAEGFRCQRCLTPTF